VTDRDRMLAEGPREAPEPLTAEAMGSGRSPAPSAARAPEAPPAPGGRRAGRSPWLRILPIALIAALTGARALGDGFGGLAVAGVILAVALIEYLRRRGR
jgi:hypothetical protein